MLQLLFNDLDVHKLALYFETELSMDELKNLINRFPKLFCRIIRDYKLGEINQKSIRVQGGNEMLIFSPSIKKIRLDIVRLDQQSHNFSKKFQELIEKASTKDELDIPEIAFAYQHKNLMECGFKFLC
jgi:hypothetical protein